MIYLNNIKIIIILVSFFIIGSVVLATSEEDIVFPIEELGGCANKQECWAYCDQPNNFAACFAFAKKHNLIKGPIAPPPPEDIDNFSRILQQQGGPGGCKTHRECEVFCNKAANITICMDWAEKNGLLSGGEINQARKVKEAMQKRGKLPGDCKDRESCELYCKSSRGIDECLAFAEEAGLIPQEELDRARKFAELMKKGETPGGCRSPEECEAYCFQEGNMEKCIDFAVNNGLMKPEEVEIFKKTGGKGPGGCRGRACETYCSDPVHQEECFQWALDHNLVRDEDLRRMEEGAASFKEGLKNLPPEVVQCLKNTVGENILNRLQEGRPVFVRDLADKMRQCFENFLRSQGIAPPEGYRPEMIAPPMPEGFIGPGGCKTPEECMIYCQQHPQECAQFIPPSGGFQPPPVPPTTTQPPEGFQPPAEQYPSPEQIQQYQQQYQPPPEGFEQPQGALQSFTANILNAVKKFFARVVELLK